MLYHINSGFNIWRKLSVGIKSIACLWNHIILWNRKSIWPALDADYGDKLPDQFLVSNKGQHGFETYKMMAGDIAVLH